ncbi:GmrSD restriction endonuclease domain-containing protein [Bacillus cereus group sp. MYBK227-1]|uniref:GmrSD restriction endonuclease domain-containing protein n=1 Tax=Bacillus cereus group sp. MYBK227-1 TaxID=3450654 RepID=UPI003F7A599E
MPVQRSGPVPPFYEYVTNKALIPHNGANTQAISNLGVHEWVEIPRYQRGISWDIENVEEFLGSPSILLGNVILAQFPHTGQFQNLQAGNYLILVDGLQRFSVGTMILAILHSKIFSTGAPFHSTDSQHFPNLLARVFALAPVYLHNDHELLNHPRNAIANQYRSLREKVEGYINEKLQNGQGSQLADLVQNTFLNRQVAVDIYFNFSAPIDIMNTFLGINTVRVDLGPVDLLRALIIEKGSSSGWSAIDIDDVENDFTAIFTNNDKPDTSLLPFVNVILRSLRRNGSRVFPSWGGTLLRSEVDDFLDFVQTFKNPVQTNGYFQEIKECGNIPFAILLSYYYIQNIHAGAPRPSFLTGGNNENSDLHSLLIASYRVLIDGTIGRTRTFAEKIVDGTLTASLSNIADAISRQFINRSVTQQLDRLWLQSTLNKVDKNKAKRIFNAMLLPHHGSVNPFNPIAFGRSSIHFHIDHLIPQSLLGSAQGDEGETLRNFAPLPQSQNRLAKATHCSSKLAPGQIYENYLSGGSHVPHPYCQWLVDSYHTIPSPSDLDRPELLEPNQTPDIGSQRIEYITNQLITRI